MESIEREWRALAERQHGAVGGMQLRAAGLSTKQVHGRVSAGELKRVARDTYRVNGSDDTFEQRAMLACLVTSGAASHRCAAALWELRRCDPGLIEVTVAERRAPSVSGVSVHTSDRLRGVDLTTVRGIPVTSPARTLVDLGAVARAQVVESAVEDALRRRLVTLDWLERTLDRIAGPGRNGSGVLRQILADRPRDAMPTESALEDDIVQLLVGAGLAPPVRQFAIPVPGRDPMRLDISYPEVLLTVEGQSVTWHTGRESLQRDCEKRNLLVALGWRVLVFTWADVHRRPAFVVGTVRHELSRKLTP